MQERNIFQRTKEFFNRNFGDHPRSTHELTAKIHSLCADLKGIILNLSEEDKQTPLADVKRNWVSEKMTPTISINFGTNEAVDKKINPHIYIFEIIQKIVRVLNQFTTTNAEETRRVAAAWETILLSVGDKPLSEFPIIMEEFLNKINSSISNPEVNSASTKQGGKEAQ